MDFAHANCDAALMTKGAPEESIRVIFGFKKETSQSGAPPVDFELLREFRANSRMAAQDFQTAVEMLGSFAEWRDAYSEMLKRPAPGRASRP